MNLSKIELEKVDNLLVQVGKGYVVRIQQSRGQKRCNSAGVLSAKADVGSVERGSMRVRHEGRLMVDVRVS